MYLALNCSDGTEIVLDEYGTRYRVRVTIPHRMLSSGYTVTHYFMRKEEARSYVNYLEEFHDSPAVEHGTNELTAEGI